MKNLFTTLLVSVIFLGCTSSPERRFAREISAFTDYSTIDWDSTIEYFFDIYEWNKERCEQFYAETSDDMLEFEVSLDFGNLRSAQKAFHHKSLPLRATASEDMLVVLNNTEAMFDTVWLRYLKRDYHEELMKDTYNEVMGPAISNLINELNRK